MSTWMLRPSAHPSFASSSRNPPAQDCASGSLSEKAIRTPIWRSRSKCCAPAASGHATDELAIPLTKSRRRISAPQGSGARRYPLDYIRDLRPAKWGLGLSLHGTNPGPLMSALGQKRTLGDLGLMSALPPKADIDRSQFDRPEM